MGTLCCSEWDGCHLDETNFGPEGSLLTKKWIMKLKKVFYDFCFWFYRRLEKRRAISQIGRFGFEAIKLVDLKTQTNKNPPCRKEGG